MDKINETKYEKVASDENEKADTIPLKYGYGIRHIQALLAFCCLSINLIARAHLSVTIVAMSDIPKENNDIVFNNTIRENFTNFSELGFKNPSNISYNVDIKNDSVQNLYKDGFNGLVIETGTLDAVNKLNKSNDEVIEGIKNVNSKLNEEIRNDTNLNISNWNVNRIYIWSKAIQEMVLGSFFLGYMIMMLPMGLICQRWGGKLPLQIGLTVSGVVSILTPWLAAWGNWKAVCTSRVVTGLFQAGTYPGVSMLVAKWVPLSERGRLGTYVYIGSMVGAVLAFQLGGLLGASPLGWPSMFWVTGSLCIIMAILMTVFGAASPELHKTITNQERNFILGRVHTGIEKRPQTPWKAIFTSKPVWASFVAHVGASTAYLFFFAQIPTYLHYILDVDIKSSGVLTSLPYLANFVTSIIFGQLCDYFTNKKILTLKQARMICNTIGNVFPAIILACLSYTSNTALGVTFLVLALATHAANHTGWMLNYIDLAPNFSGALMAIGNTLMNLNSLALPVFVSRVVTDLRDPHQWRIVMFSIAAFGIFCNTVYIFFMSTDLQPWNDPEYHATAQEEAGKGSSEKSKHESKN